MLGEFKFDHVLLVVVPVARCFPQAAIINVWRDYLMIMAFLVFGPQVVYKFVVNICTAWVEEAGAFANFIEEE